MTSTAFKFVLSITAFLTVFLLVVGLPGVVFGPILRMVQSWRAWIQKAMDDVFIHSITATEAMGMLAAGVVAAPLLVYLLSGNGLLALTSVPVVVLLPRGWSEYLRRNRRAKLEEQLPDVLDHIASSTKAGLNLVQACEEVSQQMSPPASQEFRLVVQDYRLGKDLGTCIEAERRRLRSRPFNLVASALRVNLEKGGNLPEAMATMSASLKEIWRLEQKLITASAEGRKAVKVISGMPVLIFMMVALSQPDIVETLTSNTIGWILIAVCVATYAFAIWWLLRILATDI